MNIFTMLATSQVSSLIRRSCGHMPRQRGSPLKKRRTRGTGTRTRGGLTTKLNLSLSDACIPLRFILIPGHRNDITQAPALLEGYSYEYVIGDKAYDSDAFIAEITSRDAIAVIPPRRDRTEPRAYDETLYKRRNLIERFLGWLKQYRRVATRYDKLSVRYLGFVYFAAILVTTHKM